MKRPLARLSGTGVIALVVAFVVTDVTMSSVEAWWDHHSLVTDVVASMLVLAVTVLVVDEVTVRRRVKERERVAAVQSVIVFGQAVRTEKAVVASREAQGGEGEDADAVAEVRSLAFMLLTAAPALFDDPAAREFMERAETFSVLLFRAGTAAADHALSESDRRALEDAKGELRTAVQPMFARLGRREAVILEGGDAT